MYVFLLEFVGPHYDLSSGFNSMKVFFDRGNLLTDVGLAAALLMIPRDDIEVGMTILDRCS